MKTNIIFASKDFSRATLLLEVLSRQGYSVLTAHKSREVMGMLTQRSFDLVIIGQNLTDEEGLTFLKNLRSKNKTIPVIAVLESPDTYLDHIPSGISKDNIFPHQVTGRSSAPASHKITYKLAFFQLGADECLTYSQDLQETIARVRAVIRRTASTQPDEVINMNEI